MVTPLNNLLYNMDPQNLAEHTLHPRDLHFVVNFPLLFGYLALFFVLAGVWKCKQITRDAVCGACIVTALT
ncbi:hypothetical protein, partial [Vibrio parahaemolyticus]|uniref:hypothetical protein n=1 Tax=Vibrio parahaemolyticus TaxID=670 RepID=UPI001F5D251D